MVKLFIKGYIVISSGAVLKNKQAVTDCLCAADKSIAVSVLST
jgi:hypothetical protein